MILGLATFLVLERSLIGIGYKEISPLFMRLYFLFTGGAIVGAVGLGVLLYQAQKSLEEKERELRQRNLDLMETSRMALLGEAMVGVAHDLATPLGNALLIVEELEEKVNGKEVKEDFSLLKNQILKVGQFLHKGLDLAKRKRGVMRDSASPYRAFLLAKEFLSPRLNRLQVTLEEKGLKDLPPLPATEIEWVEVFLNLLTNSLDALSPGGRIVVAGERTKEKVKIVVEDTGEGIPEEHLRKVFDPFFTTKEKGTGLGLTIVRQMVERVGGRVWLESKVREGTRVFLEFPLKEGE
jgi:signal transduction histidine kinase